MESGCNFISEATNTTILLGIFRHSLSFVLSLILIRKGKDYTYLYGKHVGTGSLTPHIDKAFDSRVDESVLMAFTYRTRFNQYHSIILDGEMLVWDPVTERNLPFGTLKTAALGK